MDLSQLESTLGVEFKNKDLLKQSLTHRSYFNEHPKDSPDHNERMEFLGDAVLELVVTEYLYSHYSNPEGELTIWRAALVNYKNLASIGEETNLNNYLRLSKGESKDFGKARQIILANAMEAVIGAIYLDSGYEASLKFINKFIISKLDDIISKQTYKDAKSNFQEIAQEKRSITPKYIVLKEWGLDHAKNFQIGVYLGEELAGTGEGISKQDAQQKAAEDATVKLGWDK